MRATKYRLGFVDGKSCYIFRAVWFKLANIEMVMKTQFIQGLILSSIRSQQWLTK